MENNFKHPEKVEMLRDAIDVSGKRLLTKSTKDVTIDNEIDLLMNIKERTGTELNQEFTRVFQELKRETKENPRLFIEGELYKFINLAKNPNETFWGGFGSAPLYQRFEDEKGKKAGLGMDTIFGNKFEKCHSMMFSVVRKVLDIERDYKEWVKLQAELNKPNVVSPFKNKQDIEDNVVMSKIGEASKVFYMDDTKNYKDRVVVCNNYGDSTSYIHEPSSTVASGT